MSIRVFQVEEEFRIYRLAGMFASNSYYGSARISMAKNEAVNARPGDEIHVLPGGARREGRREVRDPVRRPRKDHGLHHRRRDGDRPALHAGDRRPRQ
jgi:hypothetical protein